MSEKFEKRVTAEDCLNVCLFIVHPFSRNWTNGNSWTNDARNVIEAILKNSSNSDATHFSNLQSTLLRTLKGFFKSLVGCSESSRMVSWTILSRDTWISKNWLIVVGPIGSKNILRTTLCTAEFTASCIYAQQNHINSYFSYQPHLTKFTNLHRLIRLQKRSLCFGIKYKGIITKIILILRKRTKQKFQCKQPIESSSIYANLDSLQRERDNQYGNLFSDIISSEIVVFESNPTYLVTLGSSRTHLT